MKTIYKTKTFFVAGLCVAALHVHAQEDRSETDMSRELTLEREYDPSVSDANKVNTLPVVKEPEVRKAIIDYATYAVPANPLKEITVLPSGRIMTDIPYNPRRGYAHFGIGNYTNIDGDLGYHILSTEKDKLNFHYSLRSTNGNVKYVETDFKTKAKLMDNLGLINYRHDFTGAALSLGGKFNYTTFNYYGQPPLYSSKSYDLSTNQGNRYFEGYAGVVSKSNLPLGYLLNLNIGNFNQKYSYNSDFDGINETAVRVDAGVNAGFNGNQEVGIMGKIHYFTYDIPTTGTSSHSENHTEITVNPYYKLSENAWNLTLGANVMYVTGDNSKFFVSPHISADIELADKTILYLDATGKIQSNSSYEISLINRYIEPIFRVGPSKTWLDATLGLKTGVVPGLWFHVFTGYDVTDDNIFFQQREGVYLTDGWANVSTPFILDSKKFKAGVELRYAYQKYVDFYLKTVFNSWNIKDVKDDRGNTLEFKPYYKPKVEFSTGIDIRPIQKLTVSLDYLLRTDLYYSNDDKLKNISELNLKATYAINDTFGAYIKLNNLMNQKYEFLYGYPMQGINFMAGINVNF